MLKEKRDDGLLTIMIIIDLAKVPLCNHGGNCELCHSLQVKTSPNSILEVVGCFGSLYQEYLLALQAV